MRKAFKPSVIRKKSPTRDLDREISPWFILECYVKHSASLLGIDTVADALSACRKKSVAQYLSLVSSLERKAQMYPPDLDPRVVFAERQVCCLLKKFPFTKSDMDIDPRQEAIKAFFNAEQKCMETNERLKSVKTQELPHWVHPCRRIIYDILGELTPSAIMTMIKEGRHGPGSTLSSRDNRVSQYYKYFDLPYTVTPRARLYALAAISSDPKWIDYLESTGRRTEIPPPGSSRVQKELSLLNTVIEEVASDKITFVPKTCKTDRPIAVGASLNIFLQLGVKAYMERKLKKVGVDLTDQTRNQLFAKLGSKFAYKANGESNPNQFSTIDLSSASDTVSYELVKLLLPGEWFGFLEDLRHESGTLKGKTIHYSKFSAMGNGFTFPLESLLFYAISRSAIEASGGTCTYNDITVYGDDIIVRYKHSSAVISALEWSGFSVNTEKSFLSGSFKESCGCDYFGGQNVRPFYLKRRIRKYGDLYHLLNSLSGIILEDRVSYGISPLYSDILRLVDRSKLNLGPLIYSEDYLCIPLSAFKDALRPYPSLSEFEVLRRAGYFSEELETYLLPVVIRYNSIPKRYRGQDRVRYLIHLRRLKPDDKWADPIMSEPSLAGHPVRRNALREVISVAPVHDWNNGTSRHLLYRHPYYDFSEI